MACIDRVPRCGEAAGGAGSSETPLNSIWGILLLVGAIISVLGSAGTIKAIIAFLSTSAPVAGGFVAGIIALAIVFAFGMDRCNPKTCEEQCVSGVIQEIIPPEFSALTPYTAMHTRADVVIKSDYWNIAEQNFVKVYCTDDTDERRSEIIRSYYYTDKVCAVMQGAEVGAALGFVGGLLLAALLLAGCASIVLCALFVVLAALIVAASVFGGAALGGKIAEEYSDPLQSPTDQNGTTLVTGALVSVHGNLCIRDEDGHANVFWWVTLTNPHGDISAGLGPPYSYCDLDTELQRDMCSIVRIE